MSNTRQRAIKAGYRSGLEESIAKQLEQLGVPVEYEKFKIKYRVEEDRTYTPDWRFENGVIVETKGRFTAQDRKKHLLVKAQYPELDLRFVFSNSNAKLSKGSKTTYAAWCEKNGFQYADRLIPEEWVKE